MNITSKRRAILVALSDGEWSTLPDHLDQVKASLFRAGLIRCDFDEAGFAIRDRNWTITPDGIEVLEARQ